MVLDVLLLYLDCSNIPVLLMQARLRGTAPDAAGARQTSGTKSTPFVVAHAPLPVAPESLKVRCPSLPSMQARIRKHGSIEACDGYSNCWH